jgi:hypothetical protein
MYPAHFTLHPTLLSLIEVDASRHFLYSVTDRLREEETMTRYVLDDQTDIRVTDGAVEVVSEGHWKLFAP